MLFSVTETTAAMTTSSFPFVLSPERPTCAGPDGIYYDFNDGARVCLPEGQWHVRLLDDESGNILFSSDSGAGWIASTKHQVYRAGEDVPCVDEAAELEGRDVLVLFPTGKLGEMIGWFHYAERFRQRHRCNLECVIGQEIIDLLAPQYPDITFSTAGTIRTKAPYASYRVGLFFGEDTNHQPVDFRKVGFHHNAGYILGWPPERSPRA